MVYSTDGSCHQDWCLQNTLNSKLGPSTCTRTWPHPLASPFPITLPSQSSLLPWQVLPVRIGAYVIFPSRILDMNTEECLVQSHAAPTAVHGSLLHNPSLSPEWISLFFHLPLVGIPLRFFCKIDEKKKKKVKWTNDWTKAVKMCHIDTFEDDFKGEHKGTCLCRKVRNWSRLRHWL